MNRMDHLGNNCVSNTTLYAVSAKETCAGFVTFACKRIVKNVDSKTKKSFLDYTLHPYEHVDLKCFMSDYQYSRTT